MRGKTAAITRQPRNYYSGWFNLRAADAIRYAARNCASNDKHRETFVTMARILDDADRQFGIHVEPEGDYTNRDATN